MSLVEKVQVIAREQMLGIAKTIEGELKTACPVDSGEAQRSIRMTQTGETSYRIGGKNLHLFFADQGNNQKYAYFGGKRNPAAPNFKREGSFKLRFKDGSVHMYASTYEGKHFVREVADRHR